MTAAERLLQLAGTTASAAALLVSIGSGTTAGERLVAYSTLPYSSASIHILYDRVHFTDCSFASVGDSGTTLRSAVLAGAEFGMAGAAASAIASAAFAAGSAAASGASGVAAAGGGYAAVAVSIVGSSYVAWRAPDSGQYSGNWVVSRVIAMPGQLVLYSEQTDTIVL